MKREDLLLFYEYNYWATGKILASGSNLSQEQFTLESSFGHGSVRSTLVHILSAEWVWRIRCQHDESPSSLLDEDHYPTVEALRNRWLDEQKTMWGYLAGLRDEDLDRVVHYQRTGGQPEKNVLWHLLMHVVIHGAEHRSEVAALLTDFGNSPGDLDLIHFLRDRGA
ncbi:MAG: hypothetical protein GTO18_16200 [Anaerolineales bacterium]|nr:hypothetical protein [Anaerolineales bacterium]